MNKHVFQNTNQLRAALRQRFATVEHTPADNINILPLLGKRIFQPTG